MHTTKPLAGLLAVLFTLAGCGQQQGICLSKDPGGRDQCEGAQKNTCEKTPGQHWEAFKDDSAFDKVRDSCAKLGYAQPGLVGASYTKHGVH